MTILSVLFVATAAITASAINIGDTIPSLSLDYGFPPVRIDLNSRLKDKNVILLGLPGAFTPT